MWARQAPALAAAGFRAIACDLPGHGAADRPAAPGGAYATADLGTSVLEAMDEAGLDRAAVVGFSLGGGVALWLALVAPRRVASLVLAATSAWMGPGAADLFGGRAAAVEAHGAGVLVQPAIERWFTPAFAAARPATVARYAGWLAANDPCGYAAACRSLATLDLRARLPEIRCPALVLVGDQDRATPAAMAEDLARGIPGGRLCVLAPAGHLLTEERWEEFNAAVLEFLGPRGGAG